MKISMITDEQILKVIYYFVLSGFLAGCGNGSPEKEFYLADDAAETTFAGRQTMMAEPSALPAGTDLDLPVAENKIIKSGNIGLKVNDLEAARRSIDTLLVLAGGYYANESFFDHDYESVYNLTARIPATAFESFIGGIEKTGYKVVQKSISATDVTEQFIDLEMRLANRRRYLERYNELLKQARTVKDILEIEENTRKIEEEIESAEGRLKYLTSQVDYSTLYLTVAKEKEFRFEPGRRDRFFERLKQSLSKGWIGLVDFSLYLISLWHIWLILILVVFLLRRIIARRKK